MAADVPDWTQAVVSATENANGPTPATALPGFSLVTGVNGSNDFVPQPKTGAYVLRTIMTVWDPSAPSSTPDLVLTVTDNEGNEMAQFNLPGIADEYTIEQVTVDFGPTGIPVVRSVLQEYAFHISSGTSTMKALATLVFTLVPSAPFD